MNLINEKIQLPQIYTVTPDDEDARNELALEARSITSIANADEQQRASTMGSAIQKYIKSVGAARLELARPLNDAAKLLIQLETDHCAPLLAEKDRLGRLVTQFQQEERRRVEREEQARAEAIAKLEAERIALEKQAQSAAGTIQSESDLNRAIEAEKAALEANQAARQAIVAPLPEMNKARGAATRRVLKWEVVDLNALYKARPELCRIEAKASAINATCVPEMAVPGLRLWWEDATSFRARA